LDRQPAWPDIDVHALRLVAVLIKLITQHGDGDRQRADYKIKHVAASHGGFPFDEIALSAAKPKA
jgi:hypothetical protein